MGDSSDEESDTKKQAGSEAVSTPLQDEVDDDDRMSLSSLSSANEQIIEQQTVEQQNQLYTPAFAALSASHLASAPPPSLISNPLIPTLYQQRSSTSIATPSSHPTLPSSTLHLPTSLVAPSSQRMAPYVTSLHPIVTTRPSLQTQLPQTAFYGAADQFGHQLSFWGPTQQQAYLTTAPNDPTAAYYPFSNAYAGMSCHEPLPQHSTSFIQTPNQGPVKDVYACRQYSHTMLYPHHDEKTLHLADSKIMESPHFKTIE